MKTLLEKQKKLFKTGITKPISFRIAQLKHLKKGIKAMEEDIMEALYKDLHKPAFESYASEVGFVLDSLSYTIKHLEKWSKDVSVKTPIHQFGAKSYYRYEPYGTVLIIAPFNYPFQLLIEPLIGAIAAGNTAVLKPSEYTPNTERVIVKLFESYFEENYLKVVTGDKEVNAALLNLKFDYIFFTGSVPVGKIVMREAAKHLTPVTLELGGKSPAIVHKDANLEVAARRIAWGKFMNAGQICVAPDYLYVHEMVLEPFVTALRQAIELFYGEEPLHSPDYCRIVNERHFDRLVQLIEPEKVCHGGTHKKEECYIAPTIMRDVVWSDLIMQDEIFGPILPILTYKTLDEVVEGVENHPQPLACYIFSEDETVQQSLIEQIPFGGGCINDTVSHVASTYLPFGGVGSSGMGHYHGQKTFEVFSHVKSILDKSTKREIKIAYPPYNKRLVLLKKLMK